MTPTPIAPGLGRGLGSLIPKRTAAPQSAAPVVPAPSSPPGEEIHELLLSQLHANPGQPRHAIVGIEELADSVREHGILQPLVVQRSGTGEYQIIAGERRFRAAHIVGLTKVPVIVRSASRQQQLELALVENLQRRDLNPLEEAEAYQRLIDEFNLIQEAVGKRVGKSRSHVANILRLRALPETIRESLSRGEISEGHARVLLSLPTEEQQIQVWREIVQKQLPVRSLERLVRQQTGRRRYAADHSLDDVVQQLQERYQTKVTITRRGGRGKVTFDYFSDEELRGLIPRLLNK